MGLRESDSGENIERSRRRLVPAASSVAAFASGVAVAGRHAEKEPKGGRAGELTGHENIGRWRG